jgi:hypothetical protein
MTIGERITIACIVFVMVSIAVAGVYDTLHGIPH